MAYLTKTIQGLKQPHKHQQEKELTKLKKQKKYKWLSKICAATLNETVKNRVSDA
ncbi:7662_t:CDS:2 [Entrophospora sp. SA101]|nr:7662_t:CDS:2 [Entrophospora sp. SA101]